tara:strand:+ start:2148 stop:2420 length:273 start_codon:yes stop_codon:yes gene_type:complete
MKISNLNTNEAAVLNAIILSSNYNGGDFTYIDDVMHDLVEENKLLSINQVKGYLSALQTKKFIACCEDGQICAGGNFDYSNFNEPNYIGA